MAFTTDELLDSDNIASLLDQDYLDRLGMKCVENFDKDKSSRVDWERRVEESLKLALQVVETKSFPWPNASNVKFPLITIAALQYHARSYPVLINGTQVAKCRVVGKDEKGDLAKIASRVQKHMSYQILEEDENWEDQMDRVLITQPIVGCAFKKTFFDPSKGHNVSENILAKDLVVSYYTKSLDTAPRVSHVIYLSKNDIYERVISGSFLNHELYPERSGEQDELTLSRDNAQGVSEPDHDDSKPFEFIEQHCFLDLDEDGYEEPYIVTVHKETKKIFRIVARYFSDDIYRNKNGDITKIKAEQYFTKYPFIPSPDGGFYDLGFGALLGPLNESINTLINQLLDSGTLANTAGGFLSRGIRMRGGTQYFQPNEWKQVESTGDDLRKGIFPLPVREPSQVLFTLLSLLITYGERIGGSVDIMVGENPGQNTPAETSRMMVEQGMKIFTGIFKRTYRSLKDELRKWYRLNELYMVDDFQLGEDTILIEDYNKSRRNSIVPAADPSVLSDSQKLVQANQLLQIANPGMGYNMYEVHKKVLAAWRIEDVEKILPDPSGPNAMPPPKDSAVAMEEVRQQGGLQKEQIKANVALKKLEAEIQTEVAKMMSEAQVNSAKIEQLQADALLKLEQADNEGAKVQVAALDAQVGAMRARQEALYKSIDAMSKLAALTKEKTTDSSN